MKKIFQKKIIFFYLSVLTLFCLFPNKVFADGTNLTVSPSLFEIQAKPPAEVWTPFTITNESNESVTLTVGYKSFDPQASENGIVTFLKNGIPIQGEDEKIFDKMQIVNDNNISLTTIALGPKQKIRLRLHITLPNGEPSSDYYFSLLFLENTNQTNQNISKSSNSNQKTFSILQAGIGTDILLAVGDKEIPQGNISDFSTNLIRDSGPVSFNLDIFNEGSHFIRPYGQILIKNMFGQAIGRINIPPTVILAGTGRMMDSNTGSSNANLNTTSNPTLVWPQSFLLGMYTATLTFSLSQDGPTYVRTIHFFAFPIVYIGILLILIALFLIIYLRVKKKLS